MSLGGGTQDSNSNAVTNQNSFQHVAGTGSTTPLNSGQIQGALDMAQGAATGGNPFVNAGQTSVYNAAARDTNLYGAGNRTLGGTLNGSYLSAGNPYFSGMADQVGNAVRRQFSQAFSNDDASFGSPAHQAALATGLSNEIGNLAFQNYGMERGNQMAALSNMPSYVAGSLQPGQGLMAAGAAPIQQYIGALGTVSPGTTTSKDVTQAGIANGAQQGSQSGSNMNWGLSLK
jgi:hypothetical protein